MKKIIVRRQGSTSLPNLHPLLQRIYTGRGINCATELERGLEKLASYQALSNIELAVSCLVNTICAQEHILIIGDFDADGATSTALAVQCLKQFGAEKVSYLVPNRFEYGYGLSPEIVDVAARYSPHLLITVDNGISSLEGVQRAHQLNMKVLITDHHLPGSELPKADAIVNPNLPGDLFPSKNLAGVGVIFYVLMAARAKLRELHWFTQKQIAEPNMASFLDLVALGTIADVVPLDKNNRILVYQGLKRIHAGKLRPGINALLKVGGRTHSNLVATDLGFCVAPRLNAAGRLVDMKLGIECLLAEEDSEALNHAMKLDQLNKERQLLEAQMKEEALQSLLDFQLEGNLPLGICLFDENWHQGIIGIIAGRIRELFHRPVFIFAAHSQDELKGSGRSIPGLHLRDLLDRIAVQNPDLILKFGGHAMAAGLSIQKKRLPEFMDILNETLGQLLSDKDLLGVLHSDGELESNHINTVTAELLQEAGPWGQNFPEPLFDGQFEVISQQLLKEKHLKLQLRSLDKICIVDAIAFNVDPNKSVQPSERLQVAYRLDINSYRGNKTVQLMIEHFEIVQ